MRKGVLGIKLNFYAVVAFILAMFGQWLPAFLILAFVMVVEKDEWTTRQCMQAAFLGFISIVADVVYGFGNGLESMFYNVGWAGAGFGNVVGMVFGILSWLVRILVLVLAILGLAKVARGQEGNTPIVSSFADKAYGIVRQPMYRAPQPPMYNPQYPPPQQPMQQQPVPPQQQAMPQQPPQNMGGMPPAPPSGNI